jgi:hypothetical protein
MTKTSSVLWSFIICIQPGVHPHTFPRHAMLCNNLTTPGQTSPGCEMSSCLNRIRSSHRTLTVGSPNPVKDWSPTRAVVLRNPYSARRPPHTFPSHSTPCLATISRLPDRRVQAVRCQAVRTGSGVLTAPSQWAAPIHSRIWAQPVLWSFIIRIQLIYCGRQYIQDPILFSLNLQSRNSIISEA